MNIWLIQTGEPIPTQEGARKLRTTLLAERLEARGHQVVLWTSAFDHFSKKWLFNEEKLTSVSSNFKIFALKGCGYRRNISLSRYIDHLMVAKKFKKFANRSSFPDVIVASMPPYDIAFEAAIFAKKNNIPIIIDVRDEWPDIFLKFIPPLISPVFKLLLFFDYRKLKYLFVHSTSIVSMMDFLLNWALIKGNREKSEDDKIFYLGAPKIEFEKVLPVFRSGMLEEKVKNNFVVVFIGTFNNYYNPEIIINAAQKLEKENIHFILCGDGVLFNSIKEKSRKCNNVTLTGWIKTEEIPSVLKFAHIGVIPLGMNHTAFPNKVFTYLSAGLPIICCLPGEVKEIIEKHGIGLNYKFNDVGSLADNIKILYQNRLLLNKMNVNAKKIFNEMFDSEKIYHEYACYVESIVEKFNRIK